MHKTINGEIKKAGIKYIGHYNVSIIEIIGDNWRVEIPQNRLNDFTKLFPEIYWEDGAFIEEIIGKYLRVTYDENMNIHSLHHIVNQIDYMINIKISAESR